VVETPADAYAGDEPQTVPRHSASDA